MRDFAELLHSADEGDLDAMMKVSYRILFGDMTKPVEKDLFDRAVGYLKEAIDEGCTGAMISYGALYYNGRGVRQDYDEAIRWYKKAADYGDPVAISYMGYAYYYGRGSLAVDMKKAYLYYSKAALLGVPNAYYKCGDMFYFGNYVEKDPFTAFQLYSQCYEMVKDDQPIDCYPDLCRRLGTCLHKGIGTRKNLNKSMKFLMKACRLFQKRVDEGDQFTDEVLKQAKYELEEVIEELKEKQIHH